MSYAILWLKTRSLEVLYVYSAERYYVNLPYKGIIDRLKNNQIYMEIKRKIAKFHASGGVAERHTRCPMVDVELKPLP